MAQNKPIKIPFEKMSFTPDIPSGSLTPNEYNYGKNIETDLRGIKKISGEEEILSTITGSVVFITAGYRQSNQYWFIVATDEGKWFGITGSGITEITPSAQSYTDTVYTQLTAITASWNGTTLFINDSINTPMWLDATSTEIKLYDTDYNGTVYEWNYYSTQGWSNLTAGFIRTYASPNVGSILVCGNLTYDSGGTTYNLPNTLRWSQAFGLNSVPETWAPTETNIANELEIPVRGPIIDGFSLQGNFYIMSYWDTVIMSPMNYISSTTPIFGIQKLTDGRGLLNENSYAIADGVAFGIDARDIWAFDGSNFKSIANQRLKKWFYSNLNLNYVDQIFMVNNTYRNQIELYYPDMDSTGAANMMISYRYDLDVWNAPRDINNAIGAVESPIWTNTEINLATRGIVYASTTENSKLIQKDIGNSFINNANIDCVFQRDNIIFSDYSQKISVHRVLPEMYGTGNITVQLGGADSVGQNISYLTSSTVDIDTSMPWIQLPPNVNRTISIIVGSNDNSNTWTLTHATWMLTPIEEDR